MLKKIIFCLFTITLTYYKPYFIFIFFIFFLPEYFYLINILFNLYLNRNDYYVAYVTYSDLSDLNILEIWIEISKLYSFQKIYLFFLKKNTNFFNILVMCIIYISNIPFKFLKLVYYFLITNQKSFKDGLEIYYHNLYYKLKTCKIEILNKKIYLNCYTLGKLIRSMPCELQTNKQKIFNTLVDLKRVAINFKEYEDKEFNFIDLKMTKAFDKNGKLIYANHPAHLIGLRSIHGTSNKNFDLKPYQSLSNPIPSLLKKEAIAPTSVITEKIETFQQTSKKIWIPKYELFSIKFDFIEIFPLEKNDYAYQFNKYQIYKDIINLNLNEKASDFFLKELKANLYTMVLVNTSNKEFIDEINNIIY